MEPGRLRRPHQAMQLYLPFDPLAEETWQQALHSAQKDSRNGVSPRYLLGALLLKESIATQYLKQLGIAPENLLSRLPTKPEPEDKLLKLIPQLMASHASEYAQAMGSSHIRCEHFWLAVLDSHVVSRFKIDNLQFRAHLFANWPHTPNDYVKSIGSAAKLTQELLPGTPSETAATPELPMSQLLKSALSNAEALTIQASSSFISTEFVLLSILQLAKGTARAILDKQALDAQAIQVALASQIPKSPTKIDPARLSKTPRYTQVITLSHRLMLHMNQPKITTGHLLVAIMLPLQSHACEVLAEFGFDTLAARDLLVAQPAED